MSSDPISKYDSSGHNYCTQRHDTYPFIAPETRYAVFAGRYILITGASKGIGRSTALSFAKAGAAGIAILARSSGPLSTVAAEIAAAAAAAGHAAPKVVTATADITSPEQVGAAAKAVGEGFGGKLDAVVLNAGSLETVRKLAEQDPMDWWFSYQTSVLGSFLTVHACIPLLRATPGGLGTFIAMGSIGSTATFPGISGCPTAKLALTRLMEHVNCEYGNSEGGSTPLLAYTIHPGAVDHPDRDDFSAEFHAMSIDTPELAADTLVWLLRERRQWLAGRYVSCNWDMEEFSAKRHEIERRDLLKFRLAMGGEDLSKALLG